MRKFSLELIQTMSTEELNEYYIEIKNERDSDEERYMMGYDAMLLEIEKILKTK